MLLASTLPPTIRLRTACLMATRSNGTFALQLQKSPGTGSYRSAWLLAPHTALYDG